MRKDKTISTSTWLHPPLLLFASREFDVSNSTSSSLGSSSHRSTAWSRRSKPPYPPSSHHLPNLFLHLEKPPLILIGARTASLRHATVDTVYHVANHAMHDTTSSRARSSSLWPQPQQNETPFRLFKGCPNLVVDLGFESTLHAFQCGL